MPHRSTAAIFAVAFFLHFQSSTLRTSTAQSLETAPLEMEAKPDANDDTKPLADPDEFGEVNGDLDEIQFVAADTSSPRATLKSFIDACNEIHRLIQSDRYYDRNAPENRPIAYRIMDCMDVRDLPAFAKDQRTAEAAVCLKEILDRQDLPAWGDIPDSTDIDSAGGLEQLSRWRIPGTRITIARIEDGPQKHEYLFSAGTIERAPEYFLGIRSLPYRNSGPETSPGLFDWYISAPSNPSVAKIVERLPENLQFGRTLQMANWKWLGLVLSILFAGTVVVLLYRCFFNVRNRQSRVGVLKTCAVLVLPLVAAAVPFAVESFAQHYLAVRGRPLYATGLCAVVISTVQGIFLVFVSGSAIAEAIVSSPSINSRGLNAQMIRIIFRLMSLILAVTIFLIAGQYIGIPVATLLASAGIGGVALALGAQDTLKTLFGTVMLMADKPFRVGDRIVFRAYDGVVEDIGMRSTRIRLLSSHQVTIPNDELARSDIENVGRRRYIRRVANIHLPLDTPFAKTQQAAEIIRNELKDHEGMDPQFPPRVFFKDFGDTAFTIQVIYWYHPPDYWDFMAFGERFNFAVFSAFEREGIQFSIAHRITSAETHDDQHQGRPMDESK